MTIFFLFCDFKEIDFWYSLNLWESEPLWAQICPLTYSKQDIWMDILIFIVLILVYHHLSINLNFYWFKITSSIHALVTYSCDLHHFQILLLVGTRRRLRKEVLLSPMRWKLELVILTIRKMINIIKLNLQHHLTLSP